MSRERPDAPHNSPVKCCRCELHFRDDVLLVDATACPFGTPTNPTCRTRVIGTLTDRGGEVAEFTTVIVSRDGSGRRLPARTTALFLAAGRFAASIADRDGELHHRTLYDPAGAARAALARPGMPRLYCVESGLAAIILGWEIDESFGTARRASSMLYDEIDDPDAITPEGLRARYERALADAVDAVGTDAAISETGLERETVESLAAGEPVELDISDAATLLALETDRTAEEITAEIRDRLLLDMTTAVLDVETLAARLDRNLDGKEVQQRIEGRASMSLGEYAAIRHAIARGR